MKYFHFHDWTDEELAAGVYHRDRWRFVIPCVHQRNGSKERESADLYGTRGSGTAREKKGETLAVTGWEVAAC